MVTGEKLSIIERVVTVVCLCIPVVGAAFVRESGQGIVKFIGKHWDEVVQFASKYTDEFIQLLTKYSDDVIMYLAKKGDEGLTVLSRIFNMGDEIAVAGGGTIKLAPEVSTKLQDFISKSVGKVDDVADSGALKVFSSSKLMFNNVGEYYSHISDIGKRADIANDEKLKLIQDAYEALGGKKGDVTCIADIKYIIGFDLITGRPKEIKIFKKDYDIGS